MAHLTDQRIGVEPHEHHLVVVVTPAADGAPLGRRIAVSGQGRGGVGEAAPRAPGSSAVHRGGHPGEVRTRLLGRTQPAAGAQHQIAQITGHALVDPQEIVDHRLLVVAGRKTDRTTVFSVPGMHVLVRDGAVLDQPRGIGEQRFGIADVGGFVVLEPVLLIEGVAEGNEPDIFAIVPRTKQRDRLGHEPAQLSDHDIAHGEIARGVRSDADPSAARALRDWHGPEVLPGEEW